MLILNFLNVNAGTATHLKESTESPTKRFHNKFACAISNQTGSPSRPMISLVSDGLDEDLLKL